MADDLGQRYAEALAAKFTEPIYRSDKWGDNEWVENPEPADRIAQTPRIVFTAGDGHPAFRMPSCAELGEVVAAVRDEELERLRLEAHVGATDRRINLQLREEITQLRINAEKDVCSGCMQREEQRDRWMEASRQIGVKYEAAKQRWYEQAERAEKAETANAGVRALHPSREDAEAAGNILCLECAQPAPCRTRTALDDTAGT